MCLTGELPGALIGPWMPAGPWPGVSDWAERLPAMLERTERDAAEVDGWQRLKHDAAATVVATPVGEIEVVIKRPRRTSLRQSTIDLLRQARTARTWRKTWRLLTLGLPVELPLMLAETRRAGYVTDGLLVFARVPGTTLQKLPLGDIDTPSRNNLFHRVGQTLRRSADLGLAHIDAKTSNWMVFEAGPGDLRPVMIDCDGFRRLPRRYVGLRRLTRAMQTHPAIAAGDFESLKDGFCEAGADGEAVRLIDAARDAG